MNVRCRQGICRQSPRSATHLRFPHIVRVWALTSHLHLPALVFLTSHLILPYTTETYPASTTRTPTTAAIISQPGSRTMQTICTLSHPRGLPPRYSPTSDDAIARQSAHLYMLSSTPESPSSACNVYLVSYSATIKSLKCI